MSAQHLVRVREMNVQEYREMRKRIVAERQVRQARLGRAK
jgi:hypothetical protein